MRDLEKLKETYADWVRFYHITDSRRPIDVAARYAFYVAALKYYTTTELGEVSGRDHSTVVRANRIHEDNLTYFDGYKDIYHHAEEVMNVLADELTKRDDRYAQGLAVSELRDQIVKLEMLVDELRAEIANKDKQLLKRKYELCD